MIKKLHFTHSLAVAAIFIMMMVPGRGWGQTPYPMSGGNYTENFADIANWTNNFTAGTGANRWSSVAISSSGTIPDGKTTTKASDTWTTTTSGGIQKGTQALMFLSTGSTANANSVAVDLLLDFSGRVAGTLSFDWAAIDNSSGARPTSLRIYWSTDNATFTEITAAQVLEKVSSSTGSINSVALPSAFNGVSTARIRFYNHAGTATGSGNRDKMQIDNLSITSTAGSTPTKLAITSISPSSPVSGSTFSITIQAQDGSNNPANVTSATDISLTKATGAGTLGGTTTGQIANGASSVTISGVTYNTAETGVSLTATPTAGMTALTAATSSTFTVLAALPTAASAVTVSSRTNNSVGLGWTNGNGAGRIVVARLNTTSALAPTAGTAYTPNSASFSDGSNPATGTGNVVIYNGTDNSVTITGLAAATAYNFDVYEYNGSTSTYNYAAAASVGSTSTLASEPTTQASAITFSSVTATGMTIGCTGGNGTNRIFVVKSGSAVDFLPIDGTAYTANLNFTSGTGLGTNSDNKVVAVTGTSAVVTGLTSNTTYYVAIYEFTGSSTTINYLTTSPLTGNKVTLPTAATSATISNRTPTTMDLSWTNGSGTGRIVVARATTSALVAPTSGTTYNVNSNNITDPLNNSTGTGNVVVYSGTGSSTSITGLTAATQYQFYIYEYNSATSYATALTPSATYTLASEPASQTTAVLFSAITATGMTISFTKGDGANRIVLVKSGSAVNSDPVDGSTYTANTAFTSGTQIGTGNYVVYSATGASVTITGLSANTNYYVAAYEFNGSGSTSNFLTTSPATGNQITLVAAPSAPTALTFGTVTQTSFKASFIAPGTTPAGYIVLRRTGSAITGAPVGGTVYTQGQSNIGTGINDVVYVGASVWTNYDQTSLTANTTYYYSVYSYNGNTTQTNYSVVLSNSQTTSTIPVTLPYTQTFEGPTSDWALPVSGTNIWAIGTATNNGGTKGLYISNDNGVSNAYSTGTLQAANDASFSVDLAGLTTASLAFDWKSNGEAGFDYGEVYINIGASDVRISGIKEFESTTTFANKRISLTPYVGGVVTIKFRWVNDGSGGTAPPFALDNVSVAASDISTVTTVAGSPAVNSASSGGNVSSDGGSTVTRGVCYGTATGPVISGSHTTDGTGTGSFSSTLTGLIDNTLYYARAYATNLAGTAYGNEISFTTSSVAVPNATSATGVDLTGFNANWDAVTGASNGYILDVSTSGTFTSSGPAILTEGFETGLTAAYLNTTTTLGSGVWTFVDGGFAATTSGNFHNGTTGCQLKATTGIASTPALKSVTSVSFWAKSAGTSIKLNKTVGATTTTVSTVTINSTWTQYTVNVNDASANIVISFANNSGNATYIDDVSIGYTGITPSFVSGYNAKAISGQNTVTSSVTGLTSGTTYHYRVRSVGVSSTSANSTTVDVSTGNSITSVASSNWNNTSTWSPASIPTSIDDVTITSTNPVNVDIPTAACANLSIAASGVLTINSNQALTVNGTLTNSATASGLVIESGGSLLHNDAGVSATVKRLIASDGAWHFISLPFTGIMPAICDGNFASLTANFNSATGDTYDFFKWNEGIPTNSTVWTNLKTALWAPNTNDFGSPPTFESGKGYLVRYLSGFGGSTTKSSVGTLANGSQSIALTTASNKYNLVGNPFPSTIDWKAISGWGRIHLASGENLYIWNVTDGNYGAYSSGNSGDVGTHNVGRYIAPTQGFFVEASTAGNLTLDNNVRIATSSTAMKSNNAADYAIRMKVSGNTNSYSDEILVEFGHQTNTGGVAKWWSMYAEAPSLYSNKDGKDYCISFLTDATANPEIPVSFLPGVDGNYTITANSDLAYFNGVTLIDLKTGISQDLKSNPSYNFTSATTDQPDRFKLTFNSVGIDEPSATETIRAYVNGGNLYVSGTSSPAEIRVTNMLGQVVLRGKTNGNTLTSLNVNQLKNGVYVVSLVSGSKVVSTRIVVSR